MVILSGHQGFTFLQTDIGVGLRYFKAGNIAEIAVALA